MQCLKAKTNQNNTKNNSYINQNSTKLKLHGRLISFGRLAESDIAVGDSNFANEKKFNE